MLKRFVALDLETTGVDPSNDKIIEIGMARIVEGEVVATFNQLVNPLFLSAFIKFNLHQLLLM